MKKLLAILLFNCGILSAQDTIVRADSSRIIARIVKVTDNKISYTRYNDPNGTVYETSRSHIARIAYADGTREEYGMTEGERLDKRNPNIISITTTDLVAGVATINYERLIGADIGVRVIGSMGMLGTTGALPDYYSSSYYYSRYKIFSAGIDVHCYVHKGPHLSYYLGALIEYGQTRQRGYWWEFAPPPPQSKIVDYYFGGLTNGVGINTHSNIHLDMFCSLGWRNTLSGGYSDFAARFGFSVGYRF